MNQVKELAALLRERHGSAERASYTHVPVIVLPGELLESFRRSHLADLLAATGTPLTDPDEPSFGKIVLVTANDSDLVDARVTASTWDQPPWQRDAGALEVALVYEKNGASAQQCFMVYSTPDAITFDRFFYDNQRAATGYEGEHHVRSTPTDEQVADFLAIVRTATGS